MNDPLIEKTPAPATLVTPILSLISAWGIFALLQFLAFRTTGAFDYPLDDPYIHMAISETIAAGGYGVNTQELSSPGSSALFPLLLLPFNGTDVHRFMPLIWNIVGIGLTAYFWGRLLAEAGYCRRSWRALGIALALLGPFVFMMPQVGFVGMEHTLHAAAAMAVLLGLYRHLGGKGGTALILAGAFFGTALRMEGAALGLLAAGALFVSGKRGAGVLTAVVGLLPIALFSAYLMSLGLDPTPSSVKAKLAIGGADEPGFLSRRVQILMMNLRAHPGMLVGILTLGSLGLWRMSRIKDTPWGLFAAVVTLAATAHLLFGQIGWLNRYEHYILVLSAAGFLALLPKAFAGPKPGAQGALAVVAMLAGGLMAYKNPGHFMDLPPAARAIHLQQGQMARFAKDYWDQDVAVNDLGWVAWQNPNYVLDLWGLASAEARTRRLSNPSPGWTGELTAAKDVHMAMVYDHWFEDGIGTDWVRLGRLGLQVEGGFLGGYTVAFYATSPEHVEAVRAAIAAWEPTVDPRTAWVWDEGMAP